MMPVRSGGPTITRGYWAPSSDRLRASLSVTHSVRCWRVLACHFRATLNGGERRSTVPYGDMNRQVVQVI